MANDEDDELITSPGQVEGGPIVSPYQADTYDDVEMDPDAINVLGQVPEHGQPLESPIAGVQMEGEQTPSDDVEMPEMDMRPQGAPQVTSVKGKFRGVTERGKKVSGSVFDQEDAKAKAEAGELRAYNEHYGQELKLNAIATKKAIDEQAAIDQEYHTGIFGIRKQAMEFQIAEKRAEEIAFQKSQQVATQYLANYRQEMAGVRQLMMQTGNPMGKLDMGSGMALGAAMFAQGFLGARGINVDVNGQVNRWIEREMAAHQQQIENRTAAANSNLTLYGLARQGARDEAEVRERLRGFTLDALKANIYMEAAKYESGSAMADAHAKAAVVDGAIMANERAMHDRLVTDINNIETRHIQAAAARAKASVDYAELELKRQKENREAAVKEGPSEGLLSIPDPGRPIRDDKGSVIAETIGWKIDPTMDKTEAKDVRKNVTEKLGAYKGVIKATARAREIRDKYMHGDVGWIDSITPESAMRRRQYLNEMQGAIRNVRHAMAGANLTAFEKVEWDQYQGDDKLFQLGTNKGALNQLEQQIRDDFTSYVEAQPGISVATAANEPKPVTTEVDETGARYRAALGDSPEADAVQKIAGRTTDTGHNEVSRDPSTNQSAGGFSPFFLGYVKQTKDRRGIGVTDSRDKVLGQRQEIDSIDQLVRIYLKPTEGVQSTTNGQPTEDIKKLKTSAYLALESLSRGQALSGDKKPDPEVVDYAKRAFEEVTGPWAQANPEATYGAFSHRIQMSDEDYKSDTNVPEDFFAEE